jgi:hypothetical protein
VEVARGLLRGFAGSVRRVCGNTCELTLGRNGHTVEVDTFHLRRLRKERVCR